MSSDDLAAIIDMWHPLALLIILFMLYRKPTGVQYIDCVFDHSMNKREGSEERQTTRTSDDFVPVEEKDG